MKYESQARRISLGIAVLGIIGCVALLLFPQMRQVIIGFGGSFIRRSLNADVWNNILLITVAVYFCIIAAFLILFFSKFEVPQIPPERQSLVFAVTKIGLISLYSCMLIFLALANNAIWLDESHSLSQIRYSWNDLIQLRKNDVHPPLYFLTLKAASTVFGHGIAAMKMVSVFPTILMIIFTTLFLKKEFSDRAAIIFLLLCIASQTLAFYSIEIRMYSWALFFVTSMALSSWQFFKSGKKPWWIAMLLCALGSAYTHTFAAVGAGIFYVFLFFYALKYKKDRIVPMILLAVFGIVLYLPWLPSLIVQFRRTSGDFWIPPLTIRDILVYGYTVLATGNPFVTLLLYFMFAFVLYHFFSRKNKTEWDFFFFGGTCCAVLLVLSGIVISIAISPLFVARYLVPMCGLVWLFFAIECSLINRKRIIAFMYVAFVSIGIMSFSLSAYKEIKENRDYNVFYTYFTERMRQDDAFIFVPPSDTGSFYLVGIMNSLFPDNIYATIYPGQEFEDNVFHDRTTWIFVVEEEKPDAQNSDNIRWETNGEFSGSFTWNSYHFRLYKRLPFSL